MSDKEQFLVVGHGGRKGKERKGKERKGKERKEKK